MENRTADEPEIKWKTRNMFLFLENQTGMTWGVIETGSLWRLYPPHPAILKTKIEYIYFTFRILQTVIGKLKG